MKKCFYRKAIWWLQWHQDWYIYFISHDSEDGEFTKSSIQDFIWKKFNPEFPVQKFKQVNNIPVNFHLTNWGKNKGRQLIKVGKGTFTHNAPLSQLGLEACFPQSKASKRKTGYIWEMVTSDYQALTSMSWNELQRYAKDVIKIWNRNRSLHDCPMLRKTS